MSYCRLTHTKYIIFQQQTATKLGIKALEADILHYILGLITTLYKVKQLYTTRKYKKQYIEEVGQFYWYLAGLCYCLRTVFDPFVPSPTTAARPFYDWARIEDRVITIADYYRQYLAINREFPSATVDILIHEMQEYLVNVLFALGVTVEECLQASREKIGENPDAAIKAEVENEITHIKKVVTRYRGKKKPTKAEKRALESLTIGETWNEKENYAARRKRKPGPRVYKAQWRKTLQKYEQQKRERIAARSRENIHKQTRQ